ncbi:O-antigen ligase family protein [Georgenia sp. H159]|uniref:O-antigen ligase family protein n=1 Tax=Georgenia sp. H159 TaxID=3076115 RepID=UPI002D787A10|nr:O-antigen ligase family protein [Georgenia sp. H159]
MSTTTGSAAPVAGRRRTQRPADLEFRPVLLRRPDVVARWRPLLVRPWRLTTFAVLVVFLCLQFLIPARLVIGGLGSVGRPSVAVAVLLTFLWCVSARRAGGLPPGRQPVRWLLGGYLAVQLVGYAVAYDRQLPELEASSADRWLIFNVAMVGVALAVTDGVRTRRQLDVLLQTMVGLATVMAGVGILQFLRIFDLTRFIRIPGLQLNRDLIGVSARGDADFARVAGTANHYIEFGVVLALILPVALHYAFFAPRGRSSAGRWLCVALIASAIPLSISRSAVVTVAVAMGLLALAWPWRRRYNVLVIAVAGTAVFHVVNRGVLGTIRALFTNMDNDPSIQNRLADQAFVERMFAQRPWLGRGAGTVMPERYVLLDNQIYGTLVAGGVVGLVALGALFLVPYALARSTRLRAESEEARHLGQALAATMPAGLVASATFDSFSFATFVGVTVVLIGAVGALWRLEHMRPGLPLRPAAPGDTVVTTPLTANLRDRLVAGWRAGAPVGRP